MIAPYPAPNDRATHVSLVTGKTTGICYHNGVYLGWVQMSFWKQPKVQSKMGKTTGNAKTKKIHLYEDQGETSRYIDAEINEDGDLVISGQDVGKAPREFWGDADYEFWVHVPAKHKGDVFRVLLDRLTNESKEDKDEFRDFMRSRKILWAHMPAEHKDEVLLMLIKKVYADNPKTVDEFRDYLKSRGIPVEFATWA